MSYLKECIVQLTSAGITGTDLANLVRDERARLREITQLEAEKEREEKARLHEANEAEKVSLHELDFARIKHEQELAMAQAKAENVEPVRLGGNVAPTLPQFISGMIWMLISTDMKVIPCHMVGLDERGPPTLVPY